MFRTLSSAPCNCTQTNLRGGDDARSVQTLGLFVGGLIVAVFVVGIMASKAKR